jgi:hypothetical protein
MMVQKPSVCQICGCNCGLLVTLDGDQIDSGRSELDPVAIRRGMRLDQPDFGALMMANVLNLISGLLGLRLWSRVIRSPESVIFTKPASTGVYCQIIFSDLGSISNTRELSRKALLNPLGEEGLGAPYYK